jgi:uncharacterized protein (TIRG00374 family)
MRVLRQILFVAGLAVVAWLVTRIGFAPLVSSFTELSWRLAIVCLPFAIVLAVDTLGFRYAFARTNISFLSLLGARLAGETVNLITPLASVGGEAMKAWLLRRDARLGESVPALIIAKTTNTIAQTLFLMLGIVAAWWAFPEGSNFSTTMWGLLGVEVLAVGGFVGAQLGGLFRRGGRVLKLVGSEGGAEHAQALDEALRAFYRGQPRRLGLSIGFHLAGWVLGTIETLLVLHFLGAPVSIPTALVIEAFGSAVRFASFMVPASLGTLEGANAALFHGLGLGASAGLTFTLVRRARQIVWVVIGLLALVLMRPVAKEPVAVAPA